MSALDWVRTGQHVKAVFATGYGTYATGEVIAYTDRPTVTIRTEDGCHVSWIADMCVPVTTSETEQP